jgi:SAM-dependent methyltransferase
MTRRNEWEEFFDGHAPIYMENCFTKNTMKEVDFILDELNLPPGCSILDMGCGTGRHAVEFAKRGYQVTGVDISSGMLAEAKTAAREAKIKVKWIHSDATQFISDKLFDAALCLCEGAFSLLCKDDDPIEHDLNILRNVHAALKPGAYFILTALNGFAKIKQFTQKDVEKGIFDPLTMTETCLMDWETPEGKKSVRTKERGYVPTELVMLFRQAGFEVINIWGGTAGNWNRQKINLDEIEIMVVAKKSTNISL